MNWRCSEPNICQIYKKTFASEDFLFLFYKRFVLLKIHSETYKNLIMKQLKANSSTKVLKSPTVVVPDVSNDIKFLKNDVDEEVVFSINRLAQILYKTATFTK